MTRTPKIPNFKFREFLDIATFLINIHFVRHKIIIILYTIPNIVDIYKSKTPDEVKYKTKWFSDKQLVEHVLFRRSGVIVNVSSRIWLTLSIYTNNMIKSCFGQT